MKGCKEEREPRRHGGRTEKKGEKKHLRHGGEVKGHKPGHRLDKRARGGRMTPSEPLTGAGDVHGGVAAEKNDREEEDRNSGGRLTAAGRRKLPASDFALPGRGNGNHGKGPGSYPIPDKSHARNALARVAQHGNPAEQARVRAAVHRKFPGIDGG